MGASIWPEPLLWINENGPALSSSSSSTSLLPDSAKGAALPNGYHRGASPYFDLDLSGRISNIATTPGTLTIDLKFGSIVVWSSGAIPLNVVAKTDTHWRLKARLRYASVGVGTAATLIGQGEFTSHAAIGAVAVGVGGAESIMLPYNAAPAAGNGFDNSAAHLIDVVGTFSVANSGNSIQLHLGSLMGINN